MDLPKSVGYFVVLIANEARKDGLKKAQASHGP